MNATLRARFVEACWKSGKSLYVVRDHVRHGLRVQRGVRFAGARHPGRDLRRGENLQGRRRGPATRFGETQRDHHDDGEHREHGEQAGFGHQAERVPHGGNMAARPAIS